MPVTQITLLPGYPAEVRERLVRRVADAVRSVIAAPEAGTTTFVNEAATYQRDGRVFTSGNAAEPVASALVRDFLQALQARDLGLAERFLAPDFEMLVPGGVRLRSLPELLAWGRQRYQSIAKQIEGFDEAWTASGAVVHCRGTLSGEWPDGAAFAGIRFTDRFEVRAGLLCRQEVWNDLAEHR